MLIPRALLPIVVLGLISSPVAYASKPLNLNILTSLSLGYSAFEFPAKLDHDLYFPMLQLGGAVSRGNYYAALNFADSLSKAGVSEEEDIGDARRYDYDFTLGYQVTPVFGVFAGYKRGATEIDFLSRSAEDEGVTTTRDESYSQEGPFLGATYARKFGEAGKLSFNLAYADLDAENKFRGDVEVGPDTAGELEFDDLTGTVEGSTTGLSYGVRWSIPIAGKMLYYASYRVNDYKQKISLEGLGTEDVSETLSTFSMGVVYVY